MRLSSFDHSSFVMMCDVDRSSSRAYSRLHDRMLSQTAQSLQTVMCTNDSHTRRQNADVIATLVDVAENYNAAVSLVRADGMAHNMAVRRESSANVSAA